MKMNDSRVKRKLILSVCVSAAASAACAFISLPCAAICFCLAAFLNTLFIVETKKRYKELSQVNNYLFRVCAGEYSLDIPDNREGELSILKNNLYKVILLLRSSNDKLKQDKLFLADSLADISHQLKTPLSSVIIMADLLKDETDEAHRNELIDIIESQAEKMNWLIKTLLKLAKFDAGTISFNLKEIYAAEVIKKATEPFLSVMHEKGLEIIIAIDNAFRFTGDFNWSVEAFGNIIKNCVEHTPKGGRIEISTRATNIYHEISVKDSGIGISPEDLPHIFERFYTGKDSSSESIGIGLALSKTVFAREKADISVSSGSGGTRFDVRFYKVII